MLTPRSAVPVMLLLPVVKLLRFPAARLLGVRSPGGGDRLLVMCHEIQGSSAHGPRREWLSPGRECACRPGSQPFAAGRGLQLRAARARIAGGVIVVAAVAWVGVQLLRPVPSMVLTAPVTTVRVLPGAAPRPDWPGRAQAAVGLPGIGLLNARAGSLGLRGTRYADASGADPATVSTAGDQVPAHPARAADSGVPPDRGHAAGHAAGRWRGLQRQFQPRARRDRGRQDRLRRAPGGCLAFAAIRAVAGSPETIVGVVLGVQATSAQPSDLGGVISAAENLLSSVGGDLEHTQIVRPGAVLGSVSSAWTAGPAAVAATGVSVTAWPGTPVTVTGDTPTARARDQPGPARRLRNRHDRQPGKPHHP